MPAIGPKPADALPSGKGLAPGVASASRQLCVITKHPAFAIRRASRVPSTMELGPTGWEEPLFHPGGQVVKHGGWPCGEVVDNIGVKEPWLIKHGLFLSLSTRLTGVLLHAITDLSTWESRISAISGHLVPQIHQPVTTTTI
jgi:hypothetical protein